MFPSMLFKMSWSLKRFPTIIKGAMKRSFTGVDAKVSVEVSFLCERLAAVQIRASVGSLTRLQDRTPRYMGSLMNLESR